MRAKPHCLFRRGKGVTSKTLDSLGLMGTFMKGVPVFIRRSRCVGLRSEGKRGIYPVSKASPPCDPQINDLLSSLLLLARPCHHSTTSDKLLRNLESGRCGTMM